MKIYTNQFLRIQALDKCFRDKSKPYFIDDLIIACNKAIQEYYPGTKNISKRVIYDDIKVMHELEGFTESLETYRDIDKESNNKEDDYIRSLDCGKRSTKHSKEAYRYKDNTFSLSQAGMNDIETAQMREAISVMSRIKGRPGYESLNEVILKLEKDLMQDQQLPAIMSYDENANLVGLEFLKELIDSINNKIPLKIWYKPYKFENEESVIVYPYYLKQYNKRWFLFGNRKDKPNLNYIPQFAIDRIKKIVPCHTEKEKFIESTVDIENYLKHVIGVSTNFNLQPQNIILKFHPNRFNYVKTKPPHEIKFIDEDNKTIQIRVVHNKELEQVIFSYGADVKVIAPEVLRNRVKDLYEKMVKNYIQGQKEITGNGFLPY